MCILYSVIGLQNDIIYDLLVNIRGQHVCPALCCPELPELHLPELCLPELDLLVQSCTAAPVPAGAPADGAFHSHQGSA